MLTQFVSPPGYQMAPRLTTPLTTWKHLAIIVKFHNIPGVGAVTAPQANLDFMQSTYVPFFARQVLEYSRGRCAIDQTIVVPSLTLSSATSLGGGNWYVHPNDLKSSGIWAAHNLNSYDSVSVYTDQTGMPTPSYAGNTVGFWAPTNDPGVSSLDQVAPAFGATNAANDSVQLHEWLHQVESWFESPEGGSFSVPDLHGAELRINRRTNALYVDPWWDWYQDMMVARVTDGANQPGITDAMWASGRPIT